jgi:hypothetical protein
MRESRTYGSVRGACDETHVPTATGRLRQRRPPLVFAVALANKTARIAWAVMLRQRTSDRAGVVLYTVLGMLIVLSSIYIPA